MGDCDGDGLLNRTELTSFFKTFNVFLTSTDIPGFLERLGSDGTHLTKAQFAEAFTPQEEEEAKYFPLADDNLPWQCPNCPEGLLNPWENQVCVYCQTYRRPDVAAVVGQLSAVPAGQWECNICHFYNFAETFF